MQSQTQAVPETPVLSKAGTLLPYQTFGDLVLQFSSSFTKVWSDKGSGASADVSFWQVVPPTGFHPLGSLAITGYNDPSGKNWSLCVKPAATTMKGSSKAALALPVDFKLIWKDSGVRVSGDGSCWRPVPPAGYAAMGDVFVAGYNKPELTAAKCPAWCVATELVHEGSVGQEIWKDKGSGGKTDFAVYALDLTTDYVDYTEALISMNTFFGEATYTKPGTAPLHTLRLPIPMTKNPDPAKPLLDSYNPPPATTPSVVDRIVILPFTDKIDPSKSIEWKLKNSPFYALERSVYYTKLLWDHNTTKKTQDSSQSVSTGITNEASETFSVNTGMKITATKGFGPTGSSVAVELSVDFGYSKSTTVSQFVSTTNTANLRTPPSYAAATYAASAAFTAYRSDGSPVAASLPFNDSGVNYIHAQYPAATADPETQGMSFVTPA
jgi:hypothetical protein